MMPLVSVIMPTYNQARFLTRALESLIAQRLREWELIVVDDASTDETADVLAAYARDDVIRLYSNQYNRGIGYAINFGIDRARGQFIAYLPSDDVFYRDHLFSLAGELQKNPSSVLAHSGARYRYNKDAETIVPGSFLQPVQVMHRKTEDRWTERKELETDDLDRLFWSKLRKRGEFIPTRQITCEWVEHPHQRHKLIREPECGLNRFRQYYRVQEPLRLHTTVGNPIDELKQYSRFRERPHTPFAKDGLKILLVGELAYNPERILALEERGHRLYGLWTDTPYWFNSVGPLPFGHVEDLSPEDWQGDIRRIQPDVIYGLLNWQAVRFAHRVQNETRDIPFVWHFKEGPFICQEKGCWRELVELYSEADGRIYNSPETRDWFHRIIPALAESQCDLILDGDLPKGEWFKQERSPLLSDGDGEMHTVVPGRPIGLHPPDVAELARNSIHLHFYGNFTHGQWTEWIRKTQSLAPHHLHLHDQVDQQDWVAEFSQYDAGWLHFTKSENYGELHRINWDDLNLPARMATLAVSGLPLLQRDNNQSIVATQTLAREKRLGLFFTDFEQLAQQLKDSDRMAQLRNSVWAQREMFTFDWHVDRLVTFFRQVIQGKSNRKNHWRTELCTPSELMPPTMTRQRVS